MPTAALRAGDASGARASPQPLSSARPSVGRPRLLRQRVQAVTRILRFTIQIVGGIKPKGGRNSQPRRWVVERVRHEAP
jgi:hypothetical protein